MTFNRPKCFAVLEDLFQHLENMGASMPGVKEKNQHFVRLYFVDGCICTVDDLYTGERFTPKDLKE
jgi:hypothetical protein